MKFVSVLSLGDSSSDIVARSCQVCDKCYLLFPYQNNGVIKRFNFCPCSRIGAHERDYRFIRDGQLRFRILKGILELRFRRLLSFDRDGAGRNGGSH